VLRIRLDVYSQMEDVKSILVASERLFGASDPAEMMRQTRIVTEVCSISHAALYNILFDV